MCALWVPRTLHKTCDIVVYLALCASHREHFLQYVVTADKTWANHVTPITKKTFMMWEHLYLLTSQGKNLIVMPQERKSVAPVLWQLVVIVAFIDSVTVECCYGTLACHLSEIACIPHKTKHQACYCRPVLWVVMAFVQRILTPRVLILHTVSIHFDTLRSTWLASDKQQTLIWIRLSFGFHLCETNMKMSVLTK